MRNRKKLFHLLFAFAVMLGLMVAMNITAFADGQEQHKLWIQRNVITGETHNRYWDFVPEKEGKPAVLTLNNFDYFGKGEGGPGPGSGSYTINAAISYDGNLIIIVSGSNTICNTSTVNYSNYGIYVSGDLTIKGDGVLNVIAGDDNSQGGASTGIYVPSGTTLSIQEKVTLNAKGGHADGGYSRGINCDIIKNIGATIKASGSDYASFSYGIECRSIANSGTLEAIAGRGQSHSYGIQSTNIEINEQSKAVLVSGNTAAISGNVKNAVPGFGWDNEKGTGTRKDIETVSSGRELTFKRVVFPVIKSKVTFKVINGSWDDGGAAEKTVSLTGYVGGEPKLSAGDIPAVGKKPNSGYKAGSWDTTPVADKIITEDTIFTYTYAKEETPEPQPQSEASAPAAADIIRISKVPAKVKVNAKRNGVSITWNKIKQTKKNKALRKQIKNIEIQYSTDRSFPEGATDSRIIGKNRTKLVLRGLPHKTVYYVRVRYTDGIDGYSNWSKVKRVKSK